MTTMRAKAFRLMPVQPPPEVEIRFRLDGSSDHDAFIRIPLALLHELVDELNAQGLWK